MIRHHTMKNACLLLIICLAITFSGASCSMNTPTATLLAPSKTAIKPTWNINPDLSNIAILVLDYQTLELQKTYLTWQEPCNPRNKPATENDLKQKAGGLFTATSKYWPEREITDEKGNKSRELPIDIQYKADLVVLEIPAGDFGGFAVSHRCSGLVLFAGRIIWSGRGEQLYPAVPINPDLLNRTQNELKPPKQLDVVLGPYTSGKAEEGLAAWKSVQDLNLVQNLAVPPYDVLVYLYPRTVGHFNPKDASWVIFVHQYPLK